MKTQSRFTKIALASGLIVASGAAVLGITGFASAEIAQNNAAAVRVATDGSAAQSDAAIAADDDTDGQVGSQAVDGAESGTGAIIPGDGSTALPGIGHHGPRGGFVTEGLAKVLGLSVEDLKTALQTKSLATIAKDQDKDIADVKAQLLKDFSEKEQAEVAAGEHTQAEVDAKIAAFKANLDTMVNNVRPARGPGMGGMKGGPIASEAVAKSLGLTVSELQTKLQAGSSLATIAKEQNKDIADVKAALTADLKAHLDEEVKSGEHTQAEADAKLAGFTANLDNIVNGVRPAGGPGMGGMRGRHGEGHGHGMGGHGPMGGDMQGGSAQQGSAQSGTEGASFSA